MRLRPNPSAASAASAAFTATERGDRPGAEEPGLLLLETPRVERGVAAAAPPLAARVERGVAIVRAGLCKNDDGLMPGIDFVDRGLRPRVDCGSSPKKPPTISSSAPNVGVCSIGEFAESMAGVSPVPLVNSKPS